MSVVQTEEVETSATGERHGRQMSVPSPSRKRRRNVAGHSQSPKLRRSSRSEKRPSPISHTPGPSPLVQRKGGRSAAKQPSHFMQLMGFVDSECDG